MAEARYVRLRTLFGQSVVPPDSAVVIAQAVRKAIALRDASPEAPYMIIEKWAASYLAEVETDRQQLIREAAEQANRVTPTQGEHHA